ncbi:hypothetical protein BCR44DRAFT_1443841 [Catenaria anguillulae PL171]|uniref:G-protein coupled receptors family 1 profile domain-containing protein n=1 Tax=Catenaria anguillulae PL171 TaxID=765915 RepID=A0A1Y2HAS1_9FUNG|nr:hypothetical protein BCR44DRAFT_1443841 [Catenaria anguillulae PL171]
MPPPSAIAFLANLNAASGLVTFATLVSMLARGNTRIRRTFHSYIRLMIYLDSVAFLVAFVGQMATDSLTACGGKAFWLVADLFWSFKDAFKYGYLAFRCTRIVGLKDDKWHFVVHMAFGTSLVLYWFYMLMSYDLSGSCSQALIGNVNFNWSVLPLYSSWLLMDVIMASAMLYSLGKMVTEMQDVNKDLGRKPAKIELYGSVIRQERARLVVNALLMLLVNVVSVLNVVGATAVPGNSIVFVFLQHWIFVSSTSVAHAKAGTNHASATASTSGTSASGPTSVGVQRLRGKSGQI